jgi:ABC-type transport system involved in Fe-S cluster assembly fused permease/ATPase subunit
MATRSSESVVALAGACSSIWCGCRCDFTSIVSWVRWVKPLSRDSEATICQHLVYTVVPVVIEFAAVTAVLVHFKHSAYLIILGVAAVAYVAAFYRWANRIYEPSENVSRFHIESHAVLTDSLGAHETIKYFDAEPVVCSRYDEALSRTEMAWRRFFNEYAVNGLIVASVFGVSLSVSLFFGIRDVLSGAMTVGDLVLINAYVVRLVQPLELLGFAVRDIAQGTAFLERMLALFRTKSEAHDPLARKTIPRSRGELTFENVTFSYREDRVVLNNVSFHVPAGKMTAIVGVSGSGKSSLIRLLFRLYEPDSGRILLDGFPLTDLSLSEVRRAISVVAQDIVLFHDTIGKNIAFGRFGATQAEIEEAARLANLHDVIISMPDGYETIVGERGLKLSGGERQRVAIARAALKNPRMYVFDEATSSLDSRTEKDILSNLVELSNRCTTLVIAHRLSTIVRADEILVLNAGAIVERGTHANLLAKKGYYAELSAAQQSAPDQQHARTN